MMRCVAIDDEKLVRDLLEDNIRKVPYLQLVDSCRNALEAMELLQREGVALIFLDIQMSGISCMQFLSTLRHRSKQEAAPAVAPPADDFFFVNVEYMQVKINVANIRYVEGLKDYVKIHLASTDKPVLTRMTLKSMEARLADAPFIRTHKSFLVSIPHITAIKRDTLFLGERELPIGDRFREQVERM